MNTCPASPRKCAPGRLSALLACLLIVALLLPGGAGWPAQAAAATPEPPPSRLPYDGPQTLRQVEGRAAPQAGAHLAEPEDFAWSKLVFQSVRNERDWEVYSARGDGANQVNISNHRAMDIHPSLNRGATRVVFASNRHGSYDLFTMNLDGSGQVRIVDSAGDDIFPAWSPDGSRIAFQAYRDGQAEIYVANADGGDQSRLTNHGDYDGEPTWSPDGSQIAFVRRAGGQYRIWAMNADGSNQRQLSNQAYSENPAWSPDGSQIAYDCDGNGDGWQEIWLMNADGSNQQQVYDPPEGNTDAWVGGWSPDGRYVAFTRISFIYYQGQWYWTNAYLDAWDSTQPWNTIRLSSDGADWNPDWASTDALAPISSVQPLPIESPAPVIVRWSGSDAGGSGIKSYDVQVREGASGAWTNWKQGVTETAGSYPGIGGRTYYFRSRARDYAGNLEAWPVIHDAVTTVESIPPVSFVAPLPAFTKGIYAQVAWNGWDRGGSGIREFRVQCRDRAGGDWFDCISPVPQPGSVSIQGTLGHTYEYRSSATDLAGNVEPWPAEGGDTYTTLYSWHIASTVRDNRGAPVAAPQVTSTPAALTTKAGSADGSYITYVAEAATSYGVEWSKAGYGTLPATTFAGYPDGAFAAVLPPAPEDNLVNNWGFEESAPGPAWQTGGAITPILSTRSAHSGRSGMLLGWRESAFTPPNNISQLDGYSHQASVISGDDGTLHVMWVEAAGASYAETSLFYSQSNGEGSWSQPVQVSGPWSGDPQMATGQGGRVYAVWTQNYSRIYFSQKSANGEWSSPVMISNPAQGDAHQPRLAIDATGAVHVIWTMPNYYQPPVSYTRRDANGTWSAPVIISDPSLSGGWNAQLVVEQSGVVHVVWMDDGRIFYTTRNTSGSWSPPQQIFAGSFAHLAIDSSGVVHLIWTHDRNILYAQKPRAGSWSQAETAFTEANDWAASDQWDVAVESTNVVHIVVVPRSDSSVLVYLRRAGNNQWSTPYVLANVSSFEKPSATLSDDGTFHVSWQDVQEIYYARRDSQGVWSSPINVSMNSSASGAPLVVTNEIGRANVLWEDALNGATDIYHALFIPPQPAGDSWIRQQITVSASANNPTLSFLVKMKDAPLAPHNAFTISVLDGAQSTTLWNAPQAFTTWTHRWFDLNQWKGKTIFLVFRLNQAAGSISTWVDLDEITVGPGYPDIWVSLAGDNARPNEPFQYTLSYGNRGGAAATGARITAELPAGLVFVSSTPPPSSSSPQLTWNVGNLAGKSGPFTISLTARADPPVGLGAVTSTASIASQSAELETHNNNSQATTFVGHTRYLPVILLH